jgi:hypothetical protein
MAERRRPLLIENGPASRRGAEIRRVGGFSVGEPVFIKNSQRCHYRSRGKQARCSFRSAGDKKVLDAYVQHA